MNYRSNVISPTKRFYLADYAYLTANVITLRRRLCIMARMYRSSDIFFRGGGFGERIFRARFEGAVSRHILRVSENEYSRPELAVSIHISRFV